MAEEVSKQIIINHNDSETRIALMEKETVAELFIERKEERGVVGNIYLGTITRVLPGMQSAFVNVGLDRNAFLYGGDVIDPENPIARDPVGESDEDAEKKAPERRPIEKILREGQQIVVQVSKEPLGTKGARVTMYLSLPGRYLVLIPDFTHVGISRRIEEENERERLIGLVNQIKPDSLGVIIRTAAKGVHSGHLQKDLRFLLKVWRAVDAKRKRQSPPALLYQDLGLALKTTRDVYSDDVEKIIIDHEDAYQDLEKFLNASIPGAAKKLELYSDKTPIFDVHGIEMDIGRALSARIELPSGGYVIIDQTEALTSFDVNTGRFVGQLSARETILRTNLEAAKQIVAQLRVRNIGGIIVIDFIDMEELADREKVYDTFQEILQKDKAKTNVLKISELGLIQMTRKRTSESLERQLMNRCPYCDGRGVIRSTETEAYDLLREIQRCSLQTGKRRITVKARQDIRDYLVNRESELFESVTKRYKIKVDFKVTGVSLTSLEEAPFEVITQ